MDTNVDPLAAAQNAAQPTDQAPIVVDGQTSDANTIPVVPDAGLTSNPTATPGIVSFGEPVEPIAPIDPPIAINPAPAVDSGTPSEPVAEATPVDTAAPMPTETFDPIREDGISADAPTVVAPEPEALPSAEPVMTAPSEPEPTDQQVAESTISADPLNMPAEQTVSAEVPEEPLAPEPVMLGAEPAENVAVAAEEQKPSFISRLLGLVGI